MALLRCIFFWLGFTALCITAEAADPPTHVAPTKALTAKQQQKKFHLPPGFEIQLVGSEPDIGQPMNLNFDAQGRLWVTHSVEYPYPAAGPGVEKRPGHFQSPEKSRPPRDRLTLFAGIDQSGKPKRIVHFASGLNIPIGQTPLGNGNAALVYSIPSIYRVTDTNGDGKSDRRVQVYTKFGNVDTHGMASSFTRWIDGWIYGCHGFSNSSIIKDASGNVTKLQSGNTYRFRADGSRFEQFTWGQVNPFGMTFDPLGNLYDADCHSMPVYMLLQGATYPHFGRLPNKLGFGPTMINHSHGSTGICGPAYYAAKHFPEEYRNQLYICNPVSGSVHRDKLKPQGSTLLCDTQPDFIRCSDPWFRPVDAMMGPDGALYIADFYNAIIGHYEVPLKHPKRDRTRGRIWRIVYRGTDLKKSSSISAMPDLTKLSTQQLIEKLGSDNLLVRTLATNYLVDAVAKSAAAAVLKSWKTLNPLQRAHGLWVMERLSKLSDTQIKQLSKDDSRLVRVHLMKALAERAKHNEIVTATLHAALNDRDAFVRRAAVDALSRKPQAVNVPLLLSLWEKTSKQDTHLVHTIRLALQRHLSDKTVAQALTKTDVKHPLSKNHSNRLIEIAATTGNVAGATLLLHFADPNSLEPVVLIKIAGEIARHGTTEQLEHLLAKAPSWHREKKHVQLSLLQTIYDNISARNETKTPSQLIKWFHAIAPSELQIIEKLTAHWQNHPLDVNKTSPSPWGLKVRKSADGKNTLMIDSIVHGEQRTGLYRSRSFVIPEQLTFWMCGHNGYPTKSPPPVNHVRLVLIESGKTIAKCFPPRNDTAKRFTWNLKKYSGQKGVIEIVDADANDAYAWIAVGRFEPKVVSLPQASADLQNKKTLEMIGALGPNSFTPRLVRILEQKAQSTQIRIAAASSVIRLGKKKIAVEKLNVIVKDQTEPTSLRGKAAELLVLLNNESSRKTIVEVISQSSAEVQYQLALALCLTKPASGELLKAIKTGKASARLLQDRQLAQRFATNSTKQMQQEALEILKSLPSIEQQKLKLINQRYLSFLSAKTSTSNGAKVFAKNCAACHRVGNIGNQIGPQLDGIGVRGVKRLLEDILDPSRNVDPVFRSTTIQTNEGQVVVGLVLSEKNNILVLANSLGKEIRIPSKEIEKRRIASLSAMPDNFSDQIKEKELADLIAYLLTLKNKSGGKIKRQ